MKVYLNKDARLFGSFFLQGTTFNFFELEKDVYTSSKSNGYKNHISYIKDMVERELFTEVK